MSTPLLLLLLNIGTQIDPIDLCKMACVSKESRSISKYIWSKRSKEYPSPLTKYKPLPDNICWVCATKKVCIPDFNTCLTCVYELKLIDASVMIKKHGLNYIELLKFPQFTPKKSPLKLIEKKEVIKYLLTTRGGPHHCHHMNKIIL